MNQQERNRSFDFLYNIEMETENVEMSPYPREDHYTHAVRSSSVLQLLARTCDVPSSSTDLTQKGGVLPSSAESLTAIFSTCWSSKRRIYSFSSRFNSIGFCIKRTVLAWVQVGDSLIMLFFGKESHSSMAAISELRLIKLPLGCFLLLAD